jgi:predicted nucleotidyltransferase
MTIEEIKEKVIPIFEKYEVEYAGVFGSTARGDNREDSDIDMMVRIGKIPFGVWGFVGLQQELEDILGKKVDLVSQKAINKYIKPYIQRDLIKIYGEGQ